MTFQTQLAYLAWQDGRLVRKADDSVTTAPVTVIVTPDINRRDVSRLLRHLADKLEEQRT